MKISTINILFFTGVVAALSLLLAWAYRGWEEEYGWHHSHAGRDRPVIANITVNLGGKVIQEHCQTCHSEGRPVPSMKFSASSGTHPDIAPHSIYDLGCSACHLGEGMAADLRIAHGRVGNEVRKVLSGERVQATCYRCHELKILKGAEKAWEGSRLFSDNACGLCHATGEVRGGVYGPDLSDAGSFLSLKQMHSAIESPKAELENSIMPKFSLSPEEITAISYFLKSRVKNPFYETPMTRIAKRREQELAEERVSVKKAVSGMELFKEKKCLACHKFDGADGQIAPDLTYTAYMRKREYISNFLKAPSREIPGAVMPVVPMRGNEEEGIVRFLQEKRPVHLHGGVRAKNIYMMVCQRCHAAQGNGFGTIQPNLANFPRAFRGNSLFFKAIPDERIVRSIEKGIPGTSMPPYGEMFERSSINSIVDLLFRAFIRADRTDKEIEKPPAKPAVLPLTQAIAATYEKQCSKCHGIGGIGKGPQYLKYLPRPRDLTNRPYFDSRTDEQIAGAITYGVRGTGMQPFAGKAPSESIWGLVGLVREFSREKGVYDDGR
jgi:mono/diheme cytochrome c family protein